MTMTINSDVENAVAQFGGADDPVTQGIAAKTANDIHWYLFDEDADKEFEIRVLCENYKNVFLFERV